MDYRPMRQEDFRVCKMTSGGNPTNIYQQDVKQGRAMKELISTQEKTQLVKLETSIEKNLKTFEEYCRGRWEMTKTNANRLISSAQVTENSTPIGVIPAIENLGTAVPTLESKLGTNWHHSNNRTANIHHGGQ